MSIWVASGSTIGSRRSCSRDFLRCPGFSQSITGLFCIQSSSTQKSNTEDSAVRSRLMVAGFYNDGVFLALGYVGRVMPTLDDGANQLLVDLIEV